MILRLMAILSVLFLSGSRVMASATRSTGYPEYPKSEMLVEPSALVKADSAKPLVILDARQQKEYDEGRVPGAVWVDAAAWAKAFKDGKDAEGWSDQDRQAGHPRGFKGRRLRQPVVQRGGPHLVDPPLLGRR